MKQKICGKIKCAVSIIKTTFLLAFRNITGCLLQGKGWRKQLFTGVWVLWCFSLALKKSNFLWMGLMLSSITTLLFWLLTNIACNSLDWWLWSFPNTNTWTQIKTDTGQRACFRAEPATQPLSLLSSQALMKDLYLILGHLECKSTSVTRLYH